jgi:hypothetical protein
VSWRQELIETAKVFGFLFAVGFICFSIGFVAGSQAARDEAIQHGSAMESIDPESGDVRFEWK